MTLTPHFQLEEFTRSSKAASLGIVNEPTIEQISNLQNLCQEVLEPLRLHYGKSIIISSGFRSKELNQAVDGVPTSQHLTGEAADLYLPSVSIGKEWYAWIRDHCTYDQLIWERNSRGYCWIHVSCVRPPKRNRKMDFIKTVK